MSHSSYLLLIHVMCGRFHRMGSPSIHGHKWKTPGTGVEVIWFHFHERSTVSEGATGAGAAGWTGERVEVSSRLPA